MNLIRNTLIFLNLILFNVNYLFAQELLVDKIVAVVGNNIVLHSEIEARLNQLNENDKNNKNIRCSVLDELLYQKLLVTQAQKDSIEVTEAQIDQELNRRMEYYIKQFGSEDKFVAFYGKSIEDYKYDLKDKVKDILLAQQMQGKITGDITATPSDVKNYFYSISPDSIPYINMEIEIAQIVKKPKASEQAKIDAKIKIENIRQRILKGESSFATMAALYSEDPGSASKGGLYEHVQRGQFVPEWEAWAFKLKPNEISEVFETTYGYFIIQLIKRRGNEVDARSLLISPKIDVTDIVKCKQALDSVYSILKKDSISFSDVALKYSDENETKYNGGLIINPFTGSTRFQLDELGQIDQNAAFAIEKLTVGDFTVATPTTTSDGKQAYRILFLKTKTQPHRANLTDDYQAIQAAALTLKQQQVIKEWIKKKILGNYIKIADEYKNCSFNNIWITNN